MSDALVNGLAGASGGIIAQLLTYPLQAVNTRQQTERKFKETISRTNTTGKLPGTAGLIVQVLRREGWTGLYRGLQPSLVGTAVSQGVYYYFYQFFQGRAKQLVSKHMPGKQQSEAQLGTATNLLVASLAGVMNVLLTNPIWIIVTRMQTQSQVEKLSRKDDNTKADAIVRLVLPEKKRNLSAFSTVLELYREAGILGFWKGVVPTLIMVSNPAIQFSIYEGCLNYLTENRPQRKGGVKSASAIEIFGIGALAKLGATLMTYPLLVVKSRLQARQDIGLDANARYSGTMDAIFKMIRHEGIGVFYKGMGTKIMQSVFAAAILLLTKEELLKFIQNLLDRREKLRRSLLLKVVS